MFIDNLDFYYGAGNDIIELENITKGWYYMLLKDYKVIRPKDTKIQLDKKSGIRYVYHVLETKYDVQRKYNVDTRKVVGRMIDDEYMIPNDVFEKYYPDVISKDIAPKDFSDTLSIGAVSLIKYLLENSQIDELLSDIFDDKYKLIEDLLSYMIIEESCAYEYFEYFERKVCTNTRSIYSDSSVSRLLKDEISNSDINTFLDAWNSLNSNLDDVYVNIDSTNFSTRNDYGGLSEYGYAKDDKDLTQVNLTYVSSKENNRPLFYDLYPGSINDSNEVNHILNIISKYNYSNIGFIFDRAYYSKSLVKKLKKDKYFFIMMLKDNYDFVDEIIKKHRMTLTNQNTCYLSEYGVSYVTSKVNLANKNEKPLTVYVHVYYDGKRAQSKKEEFLTKIDILEKQLAKLFDENKTLTSKDLTSYEKYFKLRYNSSNYLISYKKDDRAILDEINSYGYFALMSEKDMSSKKVLETYSQRDSIEKLFRVLKSSLDFDHMGVYSKHSLESKVFLTFIASIIRNEIYIASRKLSLQDRKNLTIPVILKELSNIEASLNTTNNYYSRRYALTAKQKKILSLFSINEQYIDNTIKEFNDSLTK